MTELVNFQLETTRAEVDAERRAAEEDKDLHLESMEAFTPPPFNPLVEARFLHPVKILGTATPAVLARRLVAHWLQDTQQGVLMDLRPQPLLISRIADIPAGFLVIIRGDGDVSTSHRDAYESSEDLIPVLEGLMG